MSMFTKQASVELMKQLETHQDALILDVVEVYWMIPPKLKAAYIIVELNSSCPIFNGWTVKVDNGFFV
jgi:hypothetical protein